MTDIPRIGVGVFVFKQGQFLMGQRRGAHGNGSWSVPGGHLEFGESWETTAKREVKEEAGLHVTNVRLGGVTNDIFKTEDKHYVTIWMLSDWKAGQPTINEPDKFIKLEWYTFDNLPKPLFLPWQQLLESQFIDNIKTECDRS